MKRAPALVAVAAALLLPGCASTSLNTETYHQRLIQTLPNRRDVSFSEEAIYAGGVLCGKYTALAENGFTTRTRPFVVTREQTLRNPDTQERAIYCSDAPLEQLGNTLGFRIDETGVGQLQELVADFTAVDRAINSYHQARHSMPETLTALRDAGYLASDTALNDPWGNPYRYKPGLAGRTTPSYRLRTDGANGEPGGTGEDSDLTRRHLPVLEHVLSVNNGGA